MLIEKEIVNNKIKTLAIIVNWNTKDLLEKSIGDLLHVKEKFDLEILVIDNNSTDGSQELLKSKFNSCFIHLSNKNLGYAAANNLGFSLFPNVDYYLLINSDAYITTESFSKLLKEIEFNNNIAAITPALKLNSGKLQLGSAGFGPTWYYSINTFFYLSKVSKIFKGLFITQNNYKNTIDKVYVDWIAFACTLMRREALLSVGFFSEKYFVYGEDSDWCWRAKKKEWEIVYLPYTSIIHDVGASSENKSQLNPNWFINLSDSIKINGTKLDYNLFLISALFSYLIRYVVFSVGFFLIPDNTKRRKMCFLLAKTTLKLLFNKI